MNKLEQKLLNKLEELSPDSQVIAFFVAGSHFFDLNGPKSDTDYRGVYLPSLKHLQSKDYPKQLECGTKRSDEKRKNDPEDVDCTFYSLDEFLRLLSSGDFNMLELLYAPEDKKILTSPVWEELTLRRDMFNPRDLYSFMGFVKKEYKRYGVDTSSFYKYEKFTQFLDTLPQKDRLDKHWDKLVEWNKVEAVGQVTTAAINRHSNYLNAFKIASRLLIATNTVDSLNESCKDVLSKFGHRQQSMAKAGVEYKGLYHALRLLFEAKTLLTEDRLCFPFKKEEHEVLKKVKEGRATKEEVFDLVNRNMEVVEELEKSKRYTAEEILRYKQHLKLWSEEYFYRLTSKMYFDNIKKKINNFI